MTPYASAPRWVVCQVGAREHYAVPRALHRRRSLAALLTDQWHPEPESRLLPFAARLRGRWHPELADAPVTAFSGRMLAAEVLWRACRKGRWSAIARRNARFQRSACRVIASLPRDRVSHLFSYSYAALDLFERAKAQGWQTVLGQIDPGPEEERLVAEEHRRYPDLGTTWEPAPPDYWERWREECSLADWIVVNSRWSRDCLARAGVADGRVCVIPLAYDPGASAPPPRREPPPGRFSRTRPLRLLFLGQVNLRKGVGRLLEAMELLRGEPVTLDLVGPSELHPSAWAANPAVRWSGPVLRRDVGRHYREADLFILPTLSDGFALTQLEAMAWGLPAVVSRRCGHVVEDGVNGALLADVEPETIAASIRRIAAEPGLLRAWATGCRVPHASGPDEVARVLLDLGGLALTRS